MMSPNQSPIFIMIQHAPHVETTTKKQNGFLT